MSTDPSPAQAAVQQSGSKRVRQTAAPANLANVDHHCPLDGARSSTPERSLSSLDDLELVNVTKTSCSSFSQFHKRIAHRSE